MRPEVAAERTAQSAKRIQERAARMEVLSKELNRLYDKIDILRIEYNKIIHFFQKQVYQGKISSEEYKKLPFVKRGSGYSCPAKLKDITPK